MRFSGVSGSMVKGSSCETHFNASDSGDCGSANVAAPLGANSSMRAFSAAARVISSSVSGSSKSGSSRGGVVAASSSSSVGSGRTSNWLPGLRADACTSVDSFLPNAPVPNPMPRMRATMPKQSPARIKLRLPPPRLRGSSDWSSAESYSSVVDGAGTISTLPPSSTSISTLSSSFLLAPPLLSNSAIPWKTLSCSSYGGMVGGGGGSSTEDSSLW
mmetsp:Transcript_22979/g.65118  ORF Transcript_22979/g.65118 Transcript_22979/m.65118 type:complete len:216 (+) Transcript_22979:2255-2902(+)